MSNFQLQVKALGSPIWYREKSEYGQSPRKTEADSVSELREAIQLAADKRTLNFPEHVRIITDKGAPVERWKITPGNAKKLRRKR